MGRDRDAQLEKIGMAYGKMLVDYLGRETISEAVYQLGASGYDREALEDVVHGRGALPLRKRLSLIEEILRWIERSDKLTAEDAPDVLTSEMHAAVNRLAASVPEPVLV